MFKTIIEFITRPYRLYRLEQERQAKIEKVLDDALIDKTFLHRVERRQNLERIIRNGR